MLIEQYEIDEINNLLIKYYGYFNGELPNWRVVWGNDQYETRITDYSSEGLLLLTPKAEKLPKYIQWAKDKYILERALAVPKNTDLVALYSYEPVWIFQDKDNAPLKPRWDVARIVIEQIMANSAKAVGVKYRNPEDDPKISKEVKLARIKRIQEELFGNESDTADALAYKEGVSVPHTYEGAD